MIVPSAVDAVAKRGLLHTFFVPIAGRTYEIAAVRDQDALLQAVQTEDDLQHFPYGLMLWASAVGLAEYMAAQQARFIGKPVLEIGAGVGLAGLVAAHLGAIVTQTDYLNNALDFCRYNAAANNIEAVEVRQGDWRDWPADLPLFPLVIGSDVLYERALHPILLDLLPRLLLPNGTLLISDPLRPQALDFMERLEADGSWSVQVEAWQTQFDGMQKDLAIATLTRKG